MKQKIKGSILAYSMIVLAMMFAIVGSISAVSILEKKSAGSSQSSAQSFQVADSAVQIAIKKINETRLVNENSIISDAFPSCSGSAIVDDQIDSQKLYKLNFYDASDNPIPNCNKPLSDVESIKAIGSYKNTVRAVKVAVAAAPALTCVTRTGGLSAYCQADEIMTGGTCQGDDGCGGNDSSAYGGLFKTSGGLDGIECKQISCTTTTAHVRCCKI